MQRGKVMDRPLAREMFNMVIEIHFKGSNWNFFNDEMQWFGYEDLMFQKSRAIE